VITQEMAGTISEPGDQFGYAVAVGLWDTDTDEDLVVGTPGKLEPGFFDLDGVGLVQVYLSTSAGPGTGVSYRFARDTLNAGNIPGDRLGHALACGAFDQTDRANVAIGSPGHDDDEDGFNEILFSDYYSTDWELDVGCVFILAPWRQALDLPSRSAVVLDCEDELVFSQRPFDLTGPASTTKVMTALLALERSQLPPGHADHVDLDTDYWVDAWVDEVGGSTAELEEFEHISLRNLLRAMMTVSGNDASYAIADLLSGGAPNSIAVPAFAQAMRDRAALIGMTRTYFGNPAGRDPWNSLDVLHHSTAYDMALLGREAMANPAFHALVGMPFYDIVRDVVRDGERVDIPWTYDNAFIVNLRSRILEATGIKPGGSGGAGNTRLYAADDNGRVIAGMFYCSPYDNRSLSKRGAALLRLGFDQCGEQHFISVPNDPPPQPMTVMRAVGTATGTRRGASSDAGEHDTDSLAVEVTLEEGSGPAALRLWLDRRSSAELAPGAIAAVGLSTFQSHGGCVVRNGGPTPATIQIVASHPATVASHVLAPGQEAALGAYTGGTMSPFSLAVQNLSSDAAWLEIEERRHRLDLTVPLGAAFSGTLGHNAPVRIDALAVETLGLDAQPGNAVRVVIGPPGAVVVGVPRPERPVAGRPLVLGPASPNPFAERVQLAFDLARAGRVSVAFHDLAGRRIRGYPEESLGAGRWNFAWNGTAASGERLPGGVYFARFLLDGAEVAVQKLVVIR
jgi:D-alanyl-D-alanine carboxypeptidase